MDQELYTNPDIVDEPKDYKYSSTRDYSGKKGLLSLKMIV